MVKEDARKAKGRNRILKIEIKLPIPSGDIERKAFCHWGTSKKCSLSWKYVGKVLDPNGFFLYLSKSARVFLIRGPHVQSQPYKCKVKAVYVGSPPCTHDAWLKPLCFPVLRRVSPLLSIPRVPVT